MINSTRFSKFFLNIETRMKIFCASILCSFLLSGCSTVDGRDSGPIESLTKVYGEYKWREMNFRRECYENNFGIRYSVYVTEYAKNLLGSDSKLSCTLIENKKLSSFALPAGHVQYVEHNDSDKNERIISEAEFDLKIQNKKSAIKQYNDRISFNEKQEREKNEMQEKLQREKFDALRIASANSVPAKFNVSNKLYTVIFGTAI